MESKKINQLATNVAPQTSDLTIIGDPVTGVSKKITLLQIANLFATTGTVSSVAVTETGEALTITGSPITTAGTINIGFAGDATQYVRGDGALADFPTSTGGGSSVSYYLNSSVSQGTIGGVAYRELSKDPISGAGTDITISADGYVASYITDANDPALLEVPGGNFNCEFYFSVNSNAHNPYVYAELYKYDGTTFTLLGSSQSVPEYLSNGTTLSPYYFAIPVAASALTITDRLAVRIYVNVDTRTVTLHTENNHLCQIVTTFSKGLTSLNNLTRQVQFFGTGTSGTDFAISSSTATHTFNLPVASAANTGKLSSTDWSTFNAKQPAGNYVTLDTNQTITGLKTFNTPVAFNNALNLTFDAPVTALGNSFAIYASKISNYSILSLYDADTAKYSQLFFDNTTNRAYTFPNASGTIALTSQLTGGTVTSVGLSSATSGVTIGSSPITTSGTITLAIATASGSQNGLLSSTDWTTFNNKQNALTNPITGTGTRSINFLPVFSGSSTTIENSIIQQVSSNIGIGISPSFKLDVNGTARVSGVLTLSSTISNGTYTYTLPSATGTLALTSDLSSYLPLAGGTLTGALNGTSAVFSSTVQASAYRLTGMTAGSGALYWASDRVTLANYNASGSVVIETGGGTVALTLASNQAATFTGALSGTSATFSGTIKQTSGVSTTGATAEFYNASSVGYGMYIQAGTSANYSLLVTNYLGATAFQVLGSGAASFSSSVTTNANNLFNNTSGRAFDATSDGVLMAKNGGAHNIIFGDGNVRYFSLFTPSGAAYGSIRNFSTSTDILSFTSGGVVQIANLAGSGSRTVTADASGNLSASSDSSLKQEDTLHKIEGLAEILQLQPRAYKWKSDIIIRGEDATTEIGFFANEVNAIIPSAAPKGNDDLYGFYDRAVIAALVKAVQEQDAKIEELKALIAAK